MSNEEPKHCLGCGTELNHLDEDPNGDKNATCARCRAEEEHDYDLEPGVEFERDGSRKEKKRGIRVAGVVLTFDFEDYKGKWVDDKFDPIFKTGAKEVDGPHINGIVAVTYELLQDPMNGCDPGKFLQEIEECKTRLARALLCKL